MGAEVAVKAIERAELRIRQVGLSAALLCMLSGAAAAQEITISTGSGFVISRSGEIVTNFHVIRDCASIDVRVASTSRQKAEVIATDEGNDLAVIRVKTAVESNAVFRENPPLRPGEHVIAMGYPLSGILTTTVNVSEGIVSALAGLRDDSRYIQISAPVQPGNSGGPLLDTSGHIVGVVSGKLSIASQVVRFW